MATICGFSILVGFGWWNFVDILGFFSAGYNGHLWKQVRQGVLHHAGEPFPVSKLILLIICSSKIRLGTIWPLLTTKYYRGEESDTIIADIDISFSGKWRKEASRLEGKPKLSLVETTGEGKWSFLLVLMPYYCSVAWLPGQCGEISGQKCCKTS